MSEPLYPSGLWIGFYTYAGRPQRHRMDLHLTFSNGRLTGDGTDDVGRFLIQGRFDPATRECRWAKQYLGMHSVLYLGFREGRGIWGTWDLRLARGGFHIWPLNHASASAIAESVELEQPVSAIAPATH